MVVFVEAILSPLQLYKVILYTKPSTTSLHLLVFALRYCLFVVTLIQTKVGQKGLPSTMNPEHVAAQRAYMRYHNMNPIFGVSSKRARAANPDH